jgi:hypothetical protein
VQAWDIETTIESGTTTARERYCYGSGFPTTSVETIHESSAHITTTTTCDPPIDYKAVPELPEIDPRTVSVSNMEFPTTRRPEFLTPEVSSTGNTENSADKKEIQAAGFNKVFPEIRADSGDLDIDLPMSSSTRTLVCNESIEDNDSSISAPAGPAPKPVVALEEAIAESFFSATNHETGLSFSVQLELSGKSNSDQVLTLFGESVHVDEQGRFSVRIKLDKGPQLTALLRAQRKNILEDY